jgi:hypothetical protein
MCAEEKSENFKDLTEKLLTVDHTINHPGLVHATSPGYMSPKLLTKQVKNKQWFFKNYG